MDYWLNYTDKGNRSTRRKIGRITTLLTTKPANNVAETNLAQYSYSDVSCKCRGSTSNEAKWIPSASYGIRYKPDSKYSLKTSQVFPREKIVFHLWQCRYLVFRQLLSVENEVLVKFATRYHYQHVGK